MCSITERVDAGVLLRRDSRYSHVRNGDIVAPRDVSPTDFTFTLRLLSLSRSKTNLSRVTTWWTELRVTINGDNYRCLIDLRNIFLNGKNDALSLKLGYFRSRFAMHQADTNNTSLPSSPCPLQLLLALVSPLSRYSHQLCSLGTWDHCTWTSVRLMFFHAANALTKNKT